MDKACETLKSQKESKNIKYTKDFETIMLQVGEGPNIKVHFNSQDKMDFVILVNADKYETNSMYDLSHLNLVG